VVLTTMNAILGDKEETKELVTEALRAAWGNVKHSYQKVGDKWVAKSALLTLAPEGLSVVHGVLKEEMDRRGLRHTTPWLTEKLAAGPTMGQVHVPRSITTEVGTQEAKGGRVCPECGARTEDATCPECGEQTVAFAAASVSRKQAWHSVLKADDEERVVWGVVYAADDAAVKAWIEKGSPKESKPSTVDTQNDWITEQNLRNSYRQFMQTMDRIARSGDTRPFGVGHSVVNPNMTLLQSALLVKDTHWPEPDSTPLDASLNWVQALHVADDPTWEQVKRGELTGFSLEGLAEK